MRRRQGTRTRGCHVLMSRRQGIAGGHRRHAALLCFVVCDRTTVTHRALGTRVFGLLCRGWLDACLESLPSCAGFA
jgi:hypothetical protein